MKRPLRIVRFLLGAAVCVGVGLAFGLHAWAGNAAVPPGQLSAWALAAAAALACVQVWRRTPLRQPAAQLSFSARAT